MKNFTDEQIKTLETGMVKEFGGKLIREYIAETYPMKNGRSFIKIPNTNISFCIPVFITNAKYVYVCETTDYYNNTHHVFIDIYERR